MSFNYAVISKLGQAVLCASFKALKRYMFENPATLYVNLHITHERMGYDMAITEVRGPSRWTEVVEYRIVTTHVNGDIFISQDYGSRAAAMEVLIAMPLFEGKYELGMGTSDTFERGLLEFQAKRGFI